MPADTIKTYHVENINNDELIITGRGDSKYWQKANNLTDFVYPWENKSSTTTSFRALHNQNWFYCLFEVQATDVKVYVHKNDKMDVINSERVEIFFRKDERMTTYYGLELDPNGRVLDYEAKYHRNFYPEWSWPEGGMIVKASRTNDGYKVEAAIKKESLTKLGLLSGNKIEAGVFRAECTSLVGDQATMSWISWMVPASQTPDFHIPSAFGVLVLSE